MRKGELWGMARPLRIHGHTSKNLEKCDRILKLRERKVEVIKGALVTSYDGCVVALSDGTSIGTFFVQHGGGPPDRAACRRRSSSCFSGCQ